MAINPYQSPISDGVLPTLAASGPSRSEQLGRTFVKWEKLRIVFNLVLVLVTLVSIPFADHYAKLNSDFVVGVILGAILANVFYCTALVIDGYCRMIGIRSNVITFFLFAGGTFFAALLAAYCVVSWEPSSEL